MNTQWYDIESLYGAYGDTATFDNTYKKSLFSFSNVFNVNVKFEKLDHQNVRFLMFIQLYY